MSEAETESSLFAHPAMEFPAEPLLALNLTEPQLELQPNFEFNSSGISQSQHQESSGLTCTPDNYALQPQLREDFLEIDDLIGSTEPTFDNIEKPVENLPFEEVDGLTELDLFHDAAMFLRDIEPLDQANATAPNMNLFNYGMVNEYDYQVQQHPLLVADYNANQLWVHDQRGDDLTALESTQSVQPHPSGILNEE